MDCPQAVSDDDVTAFSGTTVNDKFNCLYGGKLIPMKKTSLILDGGSELDIRHPRFVVNARAGKEGFRGLHDSH